MVNNITQDLVGNEISIGDLCYYLKTYTTQVRCGLVKILEIKPTGIVCEVVEPNPTVDNYRGVFWDKGYITKPLASTNLIKKC